MELIDKLHEKGAEVLMSSHIFKFTPAERILEIADEKLDFAPPATVTRSTNFYNK